MCCNHGLATLRETVSVKSLLRELFQQTSTSCIRFFRYIHDFSGTFVFLAFFAARARSWKNNVGFFVSRQQLLHGSDSRFWLACLSMTVSDFRDRTGSSDWSERIPCFLEHVSVAFRTSSTVFCMYLKRFRCVFRPLARTFVVRSSRRSSTRPSGSPCAA